MNDEFKMPEVTEADVLKGEQETYLEFHNGDRTHVTVKKLNWAAALAVSTEPDPAFGLVKTVLAAVPKELANDEFLNRLTPLSLLIISNVAMTLTNGVRALGKKQAARKAAETAAPVTPSFVPPPENCGVAATGATR